jgi:hypothetical protein
VRRKTGIVHVNQGGESRSASQAIDTKNNRSNKRTRFPKHSILGRMPAPNGTVTISVLAAIVISVGVFASVHFHDILLENGTERAREEFATVSANLGRGLGTALDSSRVSFNGMHAVMRMFPTAAFEDFTVLSSGLQTNFRHLGLGYIPLLRSAEERHECETTISAALHSPRVIHQVSCSVLLLVLHSLNNGQSKSNEC